MDHFPVVDGCSCTRLRASLQASTQLSLLFLRARRALLLFLACSPGLCPIVDPTHPARIAGGSASAADKEAARRVAQQALWPLVLQRLEQYVKELSES